MQFNSKDIAEMDKRYRATLINALPGYKCLQMVGTQNSNGTPNLALFNSVFHLGSHPPLLGMICRPPAADHETLQNIKNIGFYTLNNVSKQNYQNAHQSSARYPAGVSEFADCQFTPQYLDQFKAPFVAESNIKIGLKLHECIAIKLNQTTLVIGEIISINIDDALLATDGYINHEQAATVTVVGLDSYFTGQHLDRLSYAKAKIVNK